MPPKNKKGAVTVGPAPSVDAKKGKVKKGNKKEPGMTISVSAPSAANTGVKQVTFCMYGRKVERPVEYNLMQTDFHDMFHFTDEQQLFIVIDGLEKRRVDKAEMPVVVGFARDYKLDEPVLFADDLQHGAEYVVVAHDIRMDIVDNLDVRTRTNYQLEYNALIGSEGNGTMVVQNVRSYFKQVEAERIAEVEAAGFSKKETLRQSLEIKKDIDKQVEGLRKQDMNNDGSINLDEFMCYRASAIQAVERDRLLKEVFASVTK